MGFANLSADERQTPAYAGEVTALEAWEQLKSLPQAVLIDVRTPAEWVFSGIPDLSTIRKKTQAIAWKHYPAYTLNAQFASQLASACPDKQAPLFFLCRTGGRSLDAAIAMTSEGYSQCYNVTDGFDGPLDASRHRGAIAGWKASHLPWGQE